MLYIVILCTGLFFILKSKINLDLKEGNKVKLNLQLTQEPIIQDGYQLLKKGPFWIKAPLYPRFHYGDRLHIIGITRVRVINNLFSQFWLINPEINKVAVGRQELGLGGVLVGEVYRFRDQLTKIINNLLPEPHSSLMIGILLGVKQSSSQEFFKELQQSGTLHIVVASGMNISLLAGSVSGFLAPLLNRKKAIILSLIVIVLYCILAGLEPPIVRAGLMAGVLSLAVLLGREAQGLYTLVIVGFIMLVFDPLLLFDVGFQLSFAATLGILVLGGFLKYKFAKFKFLASDLAETLSAQIFTLPILLITFGRFNPLSLLPNLLIIWLIPFVMFLGFMIVLFGLFFLPLAVLFSWFSFAVLSWFVLVIRFFGSLEFLQFNFVGLSWVFGLGYYLVLASLLFLKGKRHGA